MKIRFWSDAFKTKRASHRLRGDVMSRALRDLGHDAKASRDLSDIDQDTVVVFLKGSNAHHIAGAKSKGAFTIYDLCDNKFGEKEEYMPCCDVADAITVNSDTMRQSVLDNTGRHSSVIPDPFERPELPPHFASASPIRLLWFGGGSSLKFFPMIEVWQRLEQEIGDYELTMITSKAERLKNKQLERQNRGVYQGINFDKLRFLEWDWALQGSLLNQADIVLMPVNVEHYRTETKSANRVIDSIMSGCYVITSPLDSYIEFQPYTWQQDYIQGIRWARANVDQVQQQIAQGQIYTKQNYDAIVLAQRWLELFGSR